MGKLLNDFLKENKKDKNTISNPLYKKLELVEKEILKRKDSISQAEQSIRDNAINISSISEATGISRKTFYNNDLLSEFVNNNSTVDKETKEAISKIKDKLDDSEQKLQKLLNRDVDQITVLNEVSKLRRELEHAQKRIKSLEEQHEQDMQKLNQPVTKKNDFYA